LCWAITRDNGILTGDAFKEAYAQLLILHEAGDTNIVSMEQWEAEFTANGDICGRFAIDTTAQTFRLPCMPGCHWEGLMPETDVGDYFFDTIRPFSFSGTIVSRLNALYSGTGIVGAAFSTIGSNSAGGGNNAGEANNVHITINSASLGRHFNGLRTRPQSIAVDYQMKMYGTAADAGTVELAQLIAAMTGKLDTARYEADAPMRVKAKGVINANGTIVSSVGVISCVWTTSGHQGTGGYVITTSQNITECVCLAVTTFVTGTISVHQSRHIVINSNTAFVRFTDTANNGAQAGFNFVII
jgi:hypothetical protein